MRVLWVATKAPWPPRDGGRLLQLETLRLLAASGDAGDSEVEVELVAPAPRSEHAEIAAALAPWCRLRLVDARPWPLPIAVLHSVMSGEPVTAARHRLGAVAREVIRVAAERRLDVVNAEQAQAMPQALAAQRPVLLRAQNVESELWRGAGTANPLRRRESDRVARWEAEMVRRAALTLALTERDAATLRSLAPAARVEALPVPFPCELPAGPPLPGEPAISLLVGAGWQPNREGAEAFVARSWALVQQALPSARLHLFGDARAAGEAVTRHAPPADPAVAFAAGSILVVPLAVASGVRMKVLEAWARGVPVVATPAAAAGLDATDGQELLIAEMGEPLAKALVALARDAALRERLVRSARELLRRRHAPGPLRARLLACYADVAATASDRGSR